jgi:hypothetical protein
MVVAGVVVFCFVALLSAGFCANSLGSYLADHFLIRAEASFSSFFSPTPSLGPQCAKAGNRQRQLVILLDVFFVSAPTSFVSLSVWKGGGGGSRRQSRGSRRARRQGRLCRTRGPGCTHMALQTRWGGDGGGLYTSRARTQPPPPPRFARASSSNEPSGPLRRGGGQSQSHDPHRSRRQPMPVPGLRAVELVLRIAPLCRAVPPWQRVVVIATRHPPPADLRLEVHVTCPAQ